MNETTMQGVLAAIIETLNERDPAFAAALAPRLESVAAKSKECGWRTDAVEDFLGRLRS